MNLGESAWSEAGARYGLGADPSLEGAIETYGMRCEGGCEKLARRSVIVLDDVLMYDRS